MHVESRFPASGETLELAMPSWTPGSYLIRDYAGQVEGLEARSADGTDLPVSKIAKNRWRIDANGAGEVEVEYDVWAGTLSVQDNWVEDEFALINGAATFLYGGRSRALPQYLEVVRPSDWADVYIALPGPDARGRYRAVDFDELADSPLLAGNATEYPFQVDGAEFALVNYGETELWNSARAVEDLARIARAQLDFWGANPFERRYLFINILLSGKSGLEHDHSTVIMGAPSLMRSREDYVKWLALATHELFHAWNVRRMRPRALAEYDYDEEVYTRQLWISEGLTSYYDNLLLFRAGVITVQEYFDLLASEMQQYELQPGRAVISAESASFDSWIRHYKPNPNLINSNSNYYRKGSLIGLVADAAIRRESKGRYSLDDAMRELYARYGPTEEGAGSYPAGALAEIVASMAGEATAAEMRDLVTTPRDPDIDSALDWYGLALVRAPDRQAAEDASKPVPVDFGVTWRQDAPLLVVENVLHGSTAAEAGLLPNDELLAIDGHRVTRENHQAVVSSLRPGEVVSLTLARHQRIITREIGVQHAIPAKYMVTTKPRVSRREEARLERWLDRPLQINR